MPEVTGDAIPYKSTKSVPLSDYEKLLKENHKARQQKFMKAGLSYQRPEAKQRAEEEEQRRIDAKELAEYRALKRLEEDHPIQSAIRKIAKKYFVSVDEINSDCKIHPVVLARWEVFHYAKDTLGYSYPRIGTEMNRDSSTVYYGAERYQHLLDMRASGAVGPARKSDLPYLKILKVDPIKPYAGADE